MVQISVAVADDDDRVRAALAAVLLDDPRLRVDAVVATGQELLAHCLGPGPGPDVVLLDVRMPGGGAAAARSLAKAPGRPVVVAVTAEESATTVCEMLAAGVTGYVVKHDLAALADVVVRCARGEVVLSVPSARRAVRLALEGGAPLPD